MEIQGTETPPLRDKHVFVATKMKLMAAPANDSILPSGHNGGVGTEFRVSVSVMAPSYYDAHFLLLLLLLLLPASSVMLLYVHRNQNV